MCLKQRRKKFEYIFAVKHIYTQKQTETELIKNLNKKTAETENINKQDVECIDESSRTQERRTRKNI